MKKINRIIGAAAFTVIVAGYSALFLIAPNLGPTDDIVFLRTLQQGKPLFYDSSDFPYYDHQGLGRFKPFGVMEYNLAGSISNTPFAYFAVHAIQFVLLALILLAIFLMIGVPRVTAFVLSLYLFLLPGFAIVWFRLQLSERNVLFFGFLLVLLLQIHEKNRSRLAAFAGFLAANICIYSKETAFLLIGGLACSLLIADWKACRMRFLSVSLFLSSVLYPILYTVLISPKANVAGYDFVFQSTSPLPIIKNLFNFSTFSDPLLLFGLLPLAGYRLYRILSKRDSVHPLYDGLLLGASAFTGIYFFLFYGPYYLIPAYAFALPACAYWAKRVPRKFFIRAVYIIGFFSVVNTLPAGLHYITYNKYLPHTFTSTIDFLSKTFEEAKGKPVSLFLDAMPANNGGWGTYAILAEFILQRGFSEKNFDLKSTSGRTSDFQAFKFKQPYSVFSKGTGDPIKKGDLLIIAPQAWKDYTRMDFDKLEKSYTLVFSTKSPFLYPLLTGKTLLKQALSKSSGQSSLIENPNALERVDYYVYRKK